MNLYRYPQFTDTIIDYLPIIWIVPQPSPMTSYYYSLRQDVSPAESSSSFRRHQDPCRDQVFCQSSNKPITSSSSNNVNRNRNILRMLRNGTEFRNLAKWENGVWSFSEDRDFPIREAEWERGWAEIVVAAIRQKAGAIGV